MGTSIYIGLHEKIAADPGSGSPGPGNGLRQCLAFVPSRRKANGNKGEVSNQCFAFRLKFFGTGREGWRLKRAPFKERRRSLESLRRITNKLRSSHQTSCFRKIVG